MRASMRARAFALTLVAAFAATLALSGCVASGPSATDPRLQGTWHLASGSENGKGLPLGGRSVTFTIGDAKHTGGADECTSYRATVTGGVGVVYVHATLTGGVRDECVNDTSEHLEQLYLRALNDTKYAAISEGALVFTSATSTLVYVRTQPAPIASIKNTSWQLYSILSNVPTVTAGPALHSIRLTFDGNSGLTLSSPCVTTSGQYQIEGENFAITHLVISPGGGPLCSKDDRVLAGEATALFDGPLLLDVSSDGQDSVPMLVITALNNNLPIVWRAAS